MLLGKPGSGKGTQASLLSERYSVEHLSTGDVFRAAIKHETPIGEEVKVYMDTGELVPDDIVIRVVEQYFVEGGPWRTASSSTASRAPWCRPRRSSACSLSHPLDVVLDIEVPTEVILDRIAGRRVCINCGATYHVNMRPAVDWTCDVCGGDVVQRDDDTEEAVETRLEVYARQTVPIIDFYTNLGRLVIVDGDGKGDEVHERLAAAVDARFDPSTR